METIEIRKIISENRGYPLKITSSDGTQFYGYPRKVRSSYDFGVTHPKNFRLLLRGEQESIVFDDPDHIRDIQVLR